MTLRKNHKHTLLACYTGYITQAIVNNFAPLLFLIFQDSFAISTEKITLLVTLNFLVQLLVDLLAIKFVDKIGYRTAIVAAHIFSAAGLVGLGTLPHLFGDPFFGLLLAVVLYAIGGGLIEVLVSPIVEACPTDNKASVMSLLHSFYCWGTVFVVLVSTGFLAGFGKGSWGILAFVWALVPLANAFYFTQVPISTLTEAGEGFSVKKLFSLKLFWIFLFLMVAAGASEQAMSQWASAFAEQGLGVSKTIGDLAGPCLFSILMGLARVFHSKFEARLNLCNAVLLSGLLCVGAYLLTALSPFPWLSLLACGLCGFSVGILWPGIFSIAAVTFPKGGTALFALLALAGDLGCSGGPTVVGMVSAAFEGNLRTGLLAAVIFPVLLIACIFVYRKMQKRKVQAIA